jgi:hypothetical protein
MGVTDRDQVIDRSIVKKPDNVEPQQEVSRGNHSEQAAEAISNRLETASSKNRAAKLKMSEELLGMGLSIASIEKILNFQINECLQERIGSGRRAHAKKR